MADEAKEIVMDMISIAVMGASGRMGQELIKGVLADKFFTLAGATVRAGHDWIGRDVGACLGGADIGVKVVADTEADTLFAEVDAVLDFTSPESSVSHATLAAQAKCILVIGTTGFNEKQLEKIKMAGNHTQIIRAGNMSIGLNLLANSAKFIASFLGIGFSTDIVETHHIHKVDAPSGTAFMLKNAVDRKDVETDIHSLRAGDVVGEHDVIFSGAGERIILRHIATDRSIFVRGALYAVQWGRKQPVGEYDMQDVLARALKNPKRFT